MFFNINTISNILLVTSCTNDVWACIGRIDHIHWIGLRILLYEFETNIKIKDKLIFTVNLCIQQKKPTRYLVVNDEIFYEVFKFFSYWCHIFENHQKFVYIPIDVLKMFQCCDFTQF